jgi:hypothetical protein
MPGRFFDHLEATDRACVEECIPSEYYDGTECVECEHNCSTCVRDDPLNPNTFTCLECLPG